MMVIGLLGWWYNWYLAATEGYFRIKLCLLAPLGFFGGLLFLVRPDFAGPLRPNSSRGHKLALASVIALSNARQSAALADRSVVHLSLK